MNLRQKIDQDLKDSLLASDDLRVSTLRSLKSAITYANIEAKSKSGEDLSDKQILDVLAKEAKKRQDSADAFMKGGAKDRAEQELAEKKIIEGYLPEQVSDEELSKLVDNAITELGVSEIRAMGQVISVVRAKASGRVDGARLAQIAKERLVGK